MVIEEATQNGYDTDRGWPITSLQAILGSFYKPWFLYRNHFIKKVYHWKYIPMSAGCI